jgi:hypothetical protein
MKKVLNITLLTLTFAFIGTIDAKIMKRKTGPILVTRNEKQIFVDTKALKNASTPEEKVAASQKLATDLKNDPYSRLKTQADMIKEMIKEKEEDIWNLDDKELVQETILEKENLEEQLAEIQKKLGIYNNTQSEEISKLKNWALYTLIGTVGLAIADQLITGGAGRTALLSGANAAGSKIGSVGSSLWSYVPSWRSAPSVETVSPSTATELPVEEATSSLGSKAKWLGGAAVGLGIYIAKAQIQQYFIQKAINALLPYIMDAEENPGTVDPEELAKAQYELEELKKQNKELERQITNMKSQQQQQQLQR